MTHDEAASIFRESIAALSARLSGDYGELVPEASADRTAAVVTRLEAHGPTALRGAERAGAQDELATIDSWIRLADSAVLHDDTREAEARLLIAERLRAVRAFLAPGDELLSDDVRESQASG